ncbi:MAG: SUMF1/EgtB/PvdO family nonheme iron enzyme [Treponema sp.]|nr:SUMF1/EgtB/PvdO family nonheme iron enzyme [Treponema sp.]
MKKKSLFVIAIAFIGLAFTSCKKNHLNNNIQFVEVQLTNEDKESDLHLYVSRTEITQDQYSEIMKDNPSKVVDGQLPVTNITYDDACRYCNKLNKLFGFKDSYKIEVVNDQTIVQEYDNINGFRLLTDDESQKIYEYLLPEIGRSLNRNEVLGWHGTRLHKTAHYKPDALGLFDFLGNASEYVYIPHEMRQSEDDENRDLTYSKYLHRQSIMTYQTATDYYGESTIEKYKEYFVDQEDIIGFRICCSTSIDKSKLDILYKGDVEKDTEQWITSNLESLAKQLDFVPCEEYSYQTVGENPDETKKKITIFVPQVNACKTEITKELFNLIMKGELSDGIETPDLLQHYNDRYYGAYGFSSITPSNFASDVPTKTNVDYYDAIEFCNRLSKLSGLIPCYTTREQYEDNSAKYTYNPEANGYRLPTQAEYISFEAQHNADEDISFDATHWNWTYDNSTEQLYTTDQYNPFNEYPAGEKVIYRYAAKGRKPIKNSVGRSNSYNNSEQTTPNFCLRLFQTAKPEQITEYKQKQEEVIKTAVDEIFDSLVTMTKQEGGLKTYESLPDAEIADFEMSDEKFPNYLYKTITGKFASYKNNKEVSLSYNDIAQLCNKLSVLRGLEPCYYQKDSEDGIWECDYTKNGFRLPTIAEFMSVPNTKVSSWYWHSLCNDYYVSDAIPAWETSYPHGDYATPQLKLRHVDMYERGTLEDTSYSSFHLCKTLDIEKIQELLAQNKEEKTHLVETLDTMLDMVTIEGGNYTMAYYDKDAKKDVSKKKDIKTFYMQSSMFTNELYYKTIDGRNKSGSDYDSHEVRFIQALVICNKLSLLAHLTPAFKINGETLLSDYAIKDLDNDFSVRFYDYPDTSVTFKNKIEYDAKADGYQIPAESEWLYAGIKDSDPSAEINLITKITSLKQGEPTASGLYFMNTTQGEWCYDQGPVKSYEYDKPYYTGQREGESYQTRVVRYHCSKEPIKCWTSNGWSSYSYEYEPRNTYSPSQTFSFRVIRYK